MKASKLTLHLVIVIVNQLVIVIILILVTNPALIDKLFQQWLDRFDEVTLIVLVRIRIGLFIVVWLLGPRVYSYSINDKHRNYRAYSTI